MREEVAMGADELALLSGIRASEGDHTSCGVFADWLDEQGRTWEAVAWRTLTPPPRDSFLSSDGDGNGYGYGYGYGDGYGDGSTPGGFQMAATVGRNEMMVCQHGWVVCGFVAEQVGPFSYRVRDCSVICWTGGVPWDELADGKRRDQATYRHWGEVTITNPFLCREWKGKLPPKPKAETRS